MTRQNWVMIHPLTIMGSTLVTQNLQHCTTNGIHVSIFQLLNFQIHQTSSILLLKQELQKKAPSTILNSNHSLDGLMLILSRIPSSTLPNSANALIPPCFVKLIHHPTPHAMCPDGMNPLPPPLFSLIHLLLIMVPALHNSMLELNHLLQTAMVSRPRRHSSILFLT